MEEEWKPVYPDYEISNLGRCRRERWQKSLKTHDLKPKFDADGTAWVLLDDAFMRSGKTLHRLEVLVAEAFLGEVDHPEYRRVIHLDGDLSNCRADNLEWGEDTYVRR